MPKLGEDDLEKQLENRLLSLDVSVSINGEAVDITSDVPEGLLWS